MTTPLIVIVGETASGKSELAMGIAQKFKGEIISADSWTVYKGFDIGTAKPSRAERSKIKHHLLDIADPLRGFSAAEFKRQAVAVIDGIAGQGKLPILVGGTGLYIDSVIFDYGFLPPGELDEREKLDTLTLGQLQTRVIAAGIDTTGIDTQNKRRLVRLLQSNGKRPYRGGLRANTLILGVSIPKEQLEKQITRRVDAMLTSGLEQEVAALANKYGWDVEPMKGIGYREWQKYLAGEHTLAQTRQQIIRSTLQLAKKQRTWFRSSRYDEPSHHNVKAERNKSIHWLQNIQQAFPLVQNFLSK